MGAATKHVDLAVAIDTGELHRFSVEYSARMRDVPITTVHMEAVDHRGYGSPMS